MLRGSPDHDDLQGPAPAGDEATRRLLAMQRVTDAALSQLSQPELLKELLVRIDEILDVDTIAILMLDDDGKNLTVEAALGIEQEGIHEARVPFGQGVAGRVAAIKAPLVIENVEGTELHNPLLEKRGVRALAGVPLLVEGRCIGVLRVGTLEQRHFGDAEVGLLQLVADRAAYAIENVRVLDLERAARRSAERNANRLLRLQAVTAAMSNAITSRHVARVLIKEGLVAVGAAGGTVAMVTEEGTIRVIDAFGYPQELVERWRNFEVPSGLPLAEAIRTRQMITTSSVEERNRRFPVIGEANSGMGSLAAIPLVVEDRVLGAIGLSFTEERLFDDEDRGFMMVLAQQCAQALERARLYETERRARRDAEEAQERLAFLAAASEILSATLDYRKTLQDVARLVVPRLADWCAVHVVEPDQAIHQLAIAHVDPSKVEFARELQRRYPMDPDAVTGIPQVIRSGQPELHEEVFDEFLEMVARDEEHLAILRELQIRSVMIVPLQARGRVFGALSFVSTSEERRYREDDLTFALEVARRAGVAIDNARLYQERSHTAHTLQASLLPPELPEIPGVDLAARYRAAGEGNDVGGDFYDLFENSTDCWSLVIGDVCGKGPRAAALTGLARHTIRTAALSNAAPASVFKVLNTAVERESSDTQFCTVAYATVGVGPGGAEVTLACGGHPLPHVVRADGRVEIVGRPGTMLGILDDPYVAEDTVSLGPGDALVLYTDGVTEERREDQVFGETRLLNVLQTCNGLSASDIADRIISAVDEYRDREQRDDIAIVVLRVNETAEAQAA